MFEGKEIITVRSCHWTRCASGAIEIDQLMNGCRNLLRSSTIGNRRSLETLGPVCHCTSRGGTMSERYSDIEREWERERDIVG